MDHSVNHLQSPLFTGIEEEDLSSILSCLSAREATYKKGTYLYECGKEITAIGLVLEGTVHIIKDDFWGNRLIVGEASKGDIFGEAYACVPGEKLEIDVIAAENCKVLFLEVQKIFKTCPLACEFHSRLTRNLLTVFAGKNLMLTRKIGHMARKTTREKILSYLFSESVKAGGASFEISFNRQQLADYLCVDRSAMSSELGKMKKEGLLRFEKNRFQLTDK